MKAIWFIAQKDLLQTFRERSVIILMLVMPMIFITVIGLVVGTIGGSSGPTHMTVALSNQDNGFVGKALTQALTINNSQVSITLQPYRTAGQVSAAVAAAANTTSNLVAGVVIPAGTTTALQQAAQQNQPTSNLVQLYESAHSTDARASFIQNIVTSTVNQLVSASFASTAAVNQVEAVCHQPGNSCAPNTINAATITQIVSTSEANATKQAQVAQLAAGQESTISSFSSFDLYVPGFAVFFALLSLNAIAGTILQEKEDGTFRRLLIAPVPGYALLAGKLLTQFLLTVIQMSVLFLFGYVFFHITIGDPLAIILLILATSFGVTGLGIALVSVVKTRRQLTPVVIPVALVSGIIGGVFFPFWQEPTWMQQIARISLPYWATSGLENVIIYGRGLGYVVPNILGLLVYGLICYLIALRLFRFQEKAA